MLSAVDGDLGQNMSSSMFLRDILPTFSPNQTQETGYLLLSGSNITLNLHAASVLWTDP